MFLRAVCGLIVEMKKRYWIAGTATAAATIAVAAKLLARPHDADWQRYRHVVFHSDHSRFVEIEGARVHYQEAGEKGNPVLVLIHGFASSTLVWSKVFLNLAQAGFRPAGMIASRWSGRAAPRWRRRSTGCRDMRRHG